ncbi:MAG: hypothetical protein U0166_04400 [Acidobacteriota bacterium]
MIPALAQATPDPAANLSTVYQKIADTILAANGSERAVVQAILSTERDAALAALDRAAEKGGSAADLRTAADRIGDFATEGGAAVEPIRNRLIQSGHHHNADDTGPDAVYDPGYVVVTRKAKQEILPLAKRAAKAAEASNVDVAEVKAIREAFAAAAGKALTVK